MSMRIETIKELSSESGAQSASWSRPQQRCCAGFGGQSRRNLPSPSCSAQTDPAFEIPTQTFELQFQTVARPAHIAHLPVAQTALPVAKDFFNPTAHRTEQSVDSLHHR